MRAVVCTALGGPEVLKVLDWPSRPPAAGEVRVAIDETGKVTEAAMVKPTHASYDALLLRAARDWTYKPAMRNGRPIASEKVVEIHLEAANQE